ncbi:MAG: hypothetical protein FWG10_12440 [Eubacteriaceae bacterium]|nr:hypothetical protein [Eubacteriaceae bacterium]
MKKKRNFNEIITSGLIIALMGYLLISPKQARAAALNGYEIWLNTILPAVFPFLVLVTLLNLLGMSRKIAPMFSNFMNRAFGVSGTGAYAYLSAIFSGLPIGAKSVCDLYRQGDIDRSEAYILLCLCSNMAPVYTYSIVGPVFFGSAKLAIAFIAINYCVPVICALFVANRRDRRKVSNEPPPRASITAMKNRSKAFTAAIKESVMNILNIGGFVIFFNVIISFSRDFLGLDSNSLFGAIVSALLETANGSSALGALSNEHYIITVATCGASLCWGGLSILFQSLSFISETDLSIRRFFQYKAAQGVLGFCFGLFAANAIPRQTAPVFAELASKASAGIINILAIGVFLLIVGASALAETTLFGFTRKRK